MPRAGGKDNHRVIDGVLERRCAKCQQWKPQTLEYFTWRTGDPPRWQSPCISCQRALYTRKYSADAANDLAHALARR